MIQDSIDFKNKSRIYFALGGFCFVLLSVLAIIFFRERVAFCDTAFQMVYLLIEQKPLYMPVRFGAAISEIIPLTAIWLHSSLHTAMVVHSLSSLVLYFILFLIGFLYSKKTFVYFIIPINLLLFANDIFYWPVSDVQLGLTWLGLYAVMLFEDRWQGKIWSWPLHFLFILWVQIFHLLVFLPILLLVFYFYDSVHRLFSRRFIIHISLCLIAFIIRFIVAQNNWYERGKVNIIKSLRTYLPHLPSLHSVQAFMPRLLTVYAICIIVLLLAISWLLYTRRYLRALSVAGFCLAQWLIVMVSDPQDSGFYVENMLLPIGFMTALPLVVDIIPSFSRRFLPVWLVLIILIRVAFIYDTHRIFAERFTMYAPFYKYARHRNLNGVFVSSGVLDKNKDFMPWGSGYETMLLSSLSSPDSCTIVQFDDDVTRFGFVLQNDTSFATIYNMWGQSSVPQRYFRLRGGGYKMLLNTPDPDK